MTVRRKADISKGLVGRDRDLLVNTKHHEIIQYVWKGFENFQCYIHKS